jgi:hypothetical protein
MDMLTKLRQQTVSQENANEALNVINNINFSFSEKVKRVQELEEKSSAAEQVLFADIYSTLHLLAESQADIDLMAGV